ncbi:MAG: replication initiator protein A [Lachnospiraceae bacterium]|nr:replication initiator protein A [Lachnospiraceae bacterium]
MLMDLFIDSYYLPSSLVSSEEYEKLSDSAKILYGILLQKYVNSVREGNCDRSGRVFVTYPQKDMASDLHCSSRNVRYLVSELKQAGLIESIKKNSPGTNGSIYLNVLEAF